MQPCRVRFERLTPKDASERYREVGVICVSTDVQDTAAPDKWSDDLQKDFDDRACRLGGEVAVPVGFCANLATNGKTVSGVQFAVYRTTTPEGR